MENQMTDRSRLGDQIINRMKSALGISMDKDLAEYFDIKQASVTNWRKRGTIPVEQCMQLSGRTGITLDWLIMGRGENSIAEGTSPYYIDEEYSEIPVYDIEASAGSGSIFDQEVISGYLKFRKDWLTREGLQSSNLVAIRVSGDSMDGTLANGDTVLIDRSRKKPDGVFAIRIGDALRIKRLQKMTDGTLRVSSDNPMYQPEHIHPENLNQVDIVGQCYWRAGRVF